MRSAVTIPLWLLALLIFTICVLGLIIWTIKRRRRPRLENVTDEEGPLRETTAGLLQSTIVEGAAVELLHQGLFGGDPIAVRVAATTIALRRREAMAVVVSQKDP